MTQTCWGVHCRELSLIASGVLSSYKISYDKATDSLYIHLADRPSVDSDEVNDGVVLDFDANGALVGIDVQHASERADINNLSVSKLPLGELLAARE